jgi:short subunit dehydrogenase-like uncharacterized protein
MHMSKSQWMIYGANGYTGLLTAKEAVSRGLKPVLAGRNAPAVKKLAHELGLEFRVFDLQDKAGVVEQIRDCRLVLHCAGPFSVTSMPMIQACLDAGVHYLDITGEVAVFSDAHALSEQAKRADIVIIPGVGFDVVPSDCLAASLVRELPAATELMLAFEAGGGPSPGTARTSVEGLGKGGAVRKDSKMTSVPLAYKSRKIPFAHGSRTAMTIPWGDVYTAWVSTGVGNIEVYMSVPPATIKKLRRIRWLQPVLGSSVVQGFLKRRIEKSVKGPSDDRRSNTDAQLWGRASSSDGRSVSATMTTPNGYDLTVTASLGIAEYLLGSDVEGGYYTPSLLMGPEYATSLPGVSMQMGSVKEKSSD